MYTTRCQLQATDQHKKRSRDNDPCPTADHLPPVDIDRGRERVQRHVRFLCASQGDQNMVWSVDYCPSLEWRDTVARVTLRRHHWAWQISLNASRQLTIVVQQGAEDLVTMRPRLPIFCCALCHIVLTFVAQIEKPVDLLSSIC